VRWTAALLAAALVAALLLGPRDFVTYAVRALPLGSVFALMAVGIVLTYKTSGVLNLAYAAQAYVSAAVFFDLRDRHEWPLVPALVISVLVVAPLLGLLLDRALFRHLRSASQLAKLVTSLGLLVALPQITLIWFGKGASFNPPAIGDLTHIIRLGAYTSSVDGIETQQHIVNLDQHQLVTVVVAAVLVAGLSALFRWSPIGLQMRAVVESARLTELSGVNADRVSAFAWMLSSVFAGLAGVLLAPLFAQLNSADFFTLLVAALAAAAFGRLSSIPLTFLGAMLLAIAMQVLGNTLPEGSVITQNLRPALPFVALILLLLFWPGLRRGPELTDPLSGVEPPPPAPAATERTRGLTIATRTLAVVVVGGFTIVAMTVLDSYWLGQMTAAVILAVIFLSITVITGMGGLMSLCQATFVGVGMYGTAQVVNEWGLDVFSAILVGTVIAGVVGALVALPALRVGGIYLALVTLAFAIAFETVIAPQPWANGGSQILRVPRPAMGPIDFGGNRAFLILCMVMLAIVGVAVILLRVGTTGRFLDALRGSESAATSIGINPARAKIVAFSVSAAIAGFGGGLLVAQTGNVPAAQSRSLYFFGLVWVVLVVTIGARSVQAAITAAVGFILLPEILKNWFGLDPQWAVALFGLGALTYAKHPEGILEANTRSSLRFVQRLRHREPVSTAEAAPEEVVA
jgi:branched-subunit amino acid ABC-type transport system permease component